MHILRINLITILLLLSSSALTWAQQTEKITSPKTLPELQASIQKVLDKTNAAGVGIAMIKGDSAVWIGGLGKADIEKSIDVDENTMFRLASISKMVVSLAMLKLQEEGKISLKDKVKDVIPDLEIENPWEKAYPIRIENLLEHTAGLCYWHLAELGSDDPKPKTLKEALDFYPKSRKCIYAPGTRMRESNVGMAIAAYVIEKASGMRFEDYVDTHLFKPMGIESMTFFNSDAFKEKGASLYENGKKQSYYHGLYRPAAGLNASAKDMARFLELFINHGTVKSVRILSDTSMMRMESIDSQCHVGILKGFGLFNFADNFEGFTYRRTSGSLPGGNAEFEYLPEYKLGFVVLINDGNEGVSNYISYLIKEYQTQGLEHKSKTPVVEKQPITIEPSGYYTIINAKMELLTFIERIKNIQKVWVQNDTLCIKSLLNGTTIYKFVSIGNNEFQMVGNEAYNIAILNDPVDGQILLSNEYMKKISPFKAYYLLTLFWAFYLVIPLTIVFCLLWGLFYIFRKNKNKTALKICLWPLITNLFLLITFLIIKSNSQTRYDWFQLFGTANINSILLLLLSIGYAVASVWSVYYIFKNRRVEMSKFFYYYFALASVFNLVFMLYFLSNGLIGIPTWI